MTIIYHGGIERSFCLLCCEARMQNDGDETALKLLADKLLKLSFFRRRVVSCFIHISPLFFSKYTLFFRRRRGIIKLPESNHNIMVGSL